MQEALSISPVAWGWVTGAFTLAYAAFEIPSGTLKMVPPRRMRSLSKPGSCCLSLVAVWFWVQGYESS